MKKLICCFVAASLVTASAQADIFDVPGLPIDYIDNTTQVVGFDFPPNQLGFVDSIKSITVETNHTWSGDVEISVIAPDGQSFLLMDGVGGSTDLGGAYTFVESGGAAAGTYAAGGPGTYDAFSWGTGIWGKDGWELTIGDNAGGDTGTVSRVTIDFNKTFIPEPTSAFVLMGGLALCTRRRR